MDEDVDWRSSSKRQLVKEKDYSFRSFKDSGTAVGEGEGLAGAFLINKSKNFVSSKQSCPKICTNKRPLPFIHFGRALLNNKGLINKQ